MYEESFSRRFGHSNEPAQITIRDDAPEEVRETILKIAEADLDLSPTYLRDVLCNTLRKLPDRSNWTNYPNVWTECQQIIKGCSWYKVYDFVEAVHKSLAKSGEIEQATLWQTLINEYFLDAGIGWRHGRGTP